MELYEIFKEKQRRQCWIDTWCADEALKAYDERFNKPDKQ